jgi:cytokinesis protein
MAGVLAGIKGGVKLKSSANGTPFPGRASPGTSGGPVSTSSTAPRAPLAPISSLLHGANDSRKAVDLIASRKMKQLQWEKVSKAQLGKTVWSQPEVDDEEMVEKMKAVNLWNAMEDEFKAKEIIYDAVSEYAPDSKGEWS